MTNFHVLSPAPKLRMSRRSRVIDILTIGDDPALTASLSQLLPNSQWTIAAARTGEEAIAMLQGAPAAVAVCRERLPDAHWNAAAIALRTFPSAPALLVVSGDSRRIHEVLALGGFDILLRPLRRPIFSGRSRAPGTDG